MAPCMKVRTYVRNSKKTIISDMHIVWEGEIYSMIYIWYCVLMLLLLLIMFVEVREVVFWCDSFFADVQFCFVLKVTISKYWSPLKKSSVHCYVEAVLLLLLLEAKTRWLKG